MRSGVARDFGVHLKRTAHYKKAENYLNQSLEQKPKQFRTLLESSKCKLKQSKASEALSDANECLKLKPNNVSAKHQHAKCLDGLNQIENAISSAYGIYVKHPTNASVHHTKDSLEMSLRGAFGRWTVPILRKYKLHLKDDASEPMRKEPNGPIEVHRQTSIELMKHKLYFDSTFAEQIAFWSNVQTDETLDADLRQLIDEIIRNFKVNENRLYVREPFYARRDRFDKRSWAMGKRRTFYYAQEETRREALWQLENIKATARRGNFNTALKLTERVLSEYYATKMRTVFPAKFEFLCHVCHFIGTEYLKIYRSIPSNLMSMDIEQRLIALFSVHGKFLQGEDRCDRQVEHYNERLENAIYDMEKAYLCHKLSEINFRFRRPEESQRFARDVVIHAKKCASNVWSFLGYYNIIRVDAIKRNLHPMQDNLDQLKAVAEHLDPFAQVFVNTADRSFDDIQKMTK